MRDIALIGKGWWGRNLARNLEQLGRLARIVDGNPDVVEASRREFAEVCCGTSLDEALADPLVRAVFVATPAETHAAVALRAMECGKDVFVEKPMCLTLDEGRSMVDGARATGRVLMVGHLLLYHPAVVKLKHLIDTGALGRIRYVYSNRLNFGKIRTTENAFWSFAPHDISLISHLLGERPTTVRAEGEAYLTKKVHDVTITNLTYPSGVKAHIFVSWLHPVKEQKLVVIGDRQMAIFSDTEKDKLVLYAHQVDWVNRAPVLHTADATPVEFGAGEPLRLECEHFLECIERRLKPLSDGANGLGVIEVLTACDRSLDRGGEPVSIEAPPARPFQVHPTAVVADGARVGAGTKIWHFSHVMAGAEVGRGCNLGQNVHVAAGAKLGDNVKVQNNVSIYGGVVVESDVFLGPSCVLTNVSNPRSQVNRHSIYERTLIRRGATIGANATVVCGTTIGRYAMVAAGAVVTRDVPDYSLVMGSPARRTGWMSRHGHRLLNPDASGTMVCPESGLRYREDAPGIVRCLDLDEEATLPGALAIGKVPYREWRKSDTQDR